ncbi:hypothetical protein CCUS01_10938 [Colletotrichum cuscutae]|uniref:Uncharacterized protein n=1 Tax=Colletotrichum cuscutae TaxID=1209917 RepID=A0AAI9XKM5_9PEZI|nr:hypothetical protein CCUS01_10938 [Colletotrichum cuscutae]
MKQLPNCLPRSSMSKKSKIKKSGPHKRGASKGSVDDVAPTFIASTEKRSKYSRRRTNRTEPLNDGGKRLGKRDGGTRNGPPRPKTIEHRESAERKQRRRPSFGETWQHDKQQEGAHICSARGLQHGRRAIPSFPSSLKASCGHVLVLPLSMTQLLSHTTPPSLSRHDQTLLLLVGSSWEAALGYFGGEDMSAGPHWPATCDWLVPCQTYPGKGSSLPFFVFFFCAGLWLSTWQLLSFLLYNHLFPSPLTTRIPSPHQPTNLHSTSHIRSSGSRHELSYTNKQTPFDNTNTSINMPFTASDICKIILAIILPPVGVFLERGCGADFFINILLTILVNNNRLPSCTKRIVSAILRSNGSACDAVGGGRAFQRPWLSVSSGNAWGSSGWLMTPYLTNLHHCFLRQRHSNGLSS